MLLIVESYARYNSESITLQIANQLTKYDDYDKENDDTAMLFLLDSVDPEVKKDLLLLKTEEDCFPILWMRLVQSSSRPASISLPKL